MKTAVYENYKPTVMTKGYIVKMLPLFL